MSALTFPVEEVPAALNDRVQAAISPAAGQARTTAAIPLLFALTAAPLAFGAVEAWGWASLAVLAMLALLLWSGSCARRGSVGEPC